MAWEAPKRERFVKWEETPVVEGLLTGITVDNEGKYGPAYVYHLTLEGGEGVSAQVPKYLDRQLKAEMVGRIIRLEYQGKEIGMSGNEYRKFEVNVWTSDDDAEENLMRETYPEYGNVPVLLVKPRLT